VRPGDAVGGGDPDTAPLGSARGPRRAVPTATVHLPLGADAASADGEDGQQVHLAAVRADGAAYSLAVRGGLLQQGWAGQVQRQPRGAAPARAGDVGQVFPAGRRV
jgi:hypothetical protein